MSMLQNMPFRTDELFVLAEVTKALIAPLVLFELLDTVIDKIAEVLDPAGFGVVWILGCVQHYFNHRPSAGPDFPNLHALRQLALGQGESVTGKVVELPPDLDIRRCRLFACVCVPSAAQVGTRAKCSPADHNPEWRRLHIALS